MKKQQKVLDWATFTAYEWEHFTTEQWFGFLPYPNGGPYRIAAQGYKRTLKQARLRTAGIRPATTSLDLKTLNATELLSMTAEQLAALVAEPQYGGYAIVAQGHKKTTKQGNKQYQIIQGHKRTTQAILQGTK